MKWFGFFGFILFTLMVQAQLPQVTSGKIQRLENFQSKFVTTRHVDVWLPDGYSKDKKYAVLYMHDGQMLYDSATTWNKTAWEVDAVAGQIAAAHKVQDFIVVGVWNGGETRHIDYFPQKPWESLTAEQRSYISESLQKAGRSKEEFKPNSDNYLKFLVQELKPVVDGEFSTYEDAEHTFIAGSSMGGLISMYAICEYPHIFSRAACLSTHWPGFFESENNPVPQAFADYMRANLPEPASHKIYFDYGDQTLDAMYPPFQQLIDEVMREKGYTPNNWQTRFFAGENHSELAWSKRLSIPLLFLLGQ